MSRQPAESKISLDKANSFEEILEVYTSSDHEVKRLAIMKLDSKIDEWFEDADIEHLGQIASKAPIGSQTRKMAEKLYSARLGHY